jgi:hypothetical protein
MSDELAIEVFKKLSYRDLCNVACTCVKWNLIANDDLVRHPHLIRYTPT